MTVDAHANLGAGIVGIPPSPADSGTTLSMKAGMGALLPATDPFNATVWQAGALADYTNSEIIQMTCVGRTTLTSGSNAAVLPQATIHVASSANFDSGGGTCGIVTTDGKIQAITYTGKGSGTLTGCTGGTGTMHTGDAVVSDDFTIARETENGENGIKFGRSILVGDQLEATITKKTLTDIEASGPGGGSVAVFSAGAFQPASPPWSGFTPTFAPQITVPSDPTTQNYGEVTLPISIPRFTYPSGDVVTLNGWSVIDVDTSADDYVITLTCVITDDAGINFLVLQGTATASGGIPHDTATIAVGDVSVVDSAGVDLSYDNTTGVVSSAAGGIYAASATYVGAWS